MNKSDSITVRCLKGLGFWLVGEVMCFIICLMSSLLMSKFFIAKLFMCFCTMAVTLGMFFQYAYTAAKRDREMVKFHGQPEDKKMPYKMAAAATAPFFIMLIIIAFDKAGVIDDLIYTKEYTRQVAVTETINTDAMYSETSAEEIVSETSSAEESAVSSTETTAVQYVEETGEVEFRVFSIYLMANMHVLPFVSLFSELRSIDAVSWGGMFGLLVLELLSPAIIIVTYRIVYNDIDVKKLIMYKKD